MGRGRRSQQNQTRTGEQPSPNFQLIAALIAAVGLIIVALINRSTEITTTLKPIEFTQTAEALHTSIAETATWSVFQTQTQAANMSMTALSGTQTASAVEAEKESLAIFASQTAEFQVYMTQTANAQVVFAPIEIKPVRYEHVVEVGETLREISKKYFIVDFYADAIGRANCKPSPVAGDILVIKYYVIQLGDTLDGIAAKISAKVDFLRHINNLSDDVVVLPANQILILPGNCGG